MRPLRAPDNRLYLGTGGSGKTTLALAHLGAFPRTLIVDTTGQDALGRGARVTDNAARLVQLLQEHRAEPCRITWRPATDDLFEWGNRVAWAAGDLAVLWDDADLFMGPQRLPPMSRQLWNMGRHRGVRVFITSRRPAAVSRDCTANLARAAVFRMQDPADVRWLRGFLDQAGAERSRALDFPAHEYIEWDMSGWRVKAAEKPAKST